MENTLQKAPTGIGSRGGKWYVNSHGIDVYGTPPNSKPHLLDDHEFPYGGKKYTIDGVHPARKDSFLLRDDKGQLHQRSVNGIIPYHEGDIGTHPDLAKPDDGFYNYNNNSNYDKDDYREDDDDDEDDDYNEDDDDYNEDNSKKQSSSGYVIDEHGKKKSPVITIGHYRNSNDNSETGLKKYNEYRKVLKQKNGVHPLLEGHGWERTDEDSNDKKHTWHNKSENVPASITHYNKTDKWKGEDFRYGGPLESTRGYNFQPDSHKYLDSAGKVIEGHPSDLLTSHLEGKVTNFTGPRNLYNTPLHKDYKEKMGAIGASSAPENTSSIVRNNDHGRSYESSIHDPSQEPAINRRYSHVGVNPKNGKNVIADYSHDKHHGLLYEVHEGPDNTEDDQYELRPYRSNARPLSLGPSVKSRLEHLRSLRLMQRGRLVKSLADELVSLEVEDNIMYGPDSSD